MKYIRTLLLLIIITSLSSAQITDQISFRASDFEITTELAPDSNYYHRVECSLANQTLTDDPGRPWLPVVNFVYSLPQGMKIDGVTINNAENVLLEELVEMVYPRQYLQPTCIECEWPDFVPPDTSVILDDPPLISVIHSASYACGMSVGVIQVRPISYIWESNALILNENISFTINLVADSNQPLEVNSRSIYSQQVVESYAKSIVWNTADAELNLPDIQTYAYGDPEDPDDIPPDYLVITSNALLGDVQYLADYKFKFGHKIEVATVENIHSVYSGIDIQASIRDYLRFKYSEGTLYAILVGDENIVPFRYAYFGNWQDGDTPPIEDMIPSDLYYSCLDGTWDADGDGIFGENDDQVDLAADLFVGRIPINDTGQVAIWLDKLIRYEQNPGNGEPSYVMNALMSSADQLTDLRRDEYIAESFTYNPNFAVDFYTLREYPSGSNHNPSSPYGEDIVNQLNNPGAGYFLSLNHGSPAWFAASAAGYNCLNVLPEDCWRSGMTTDPSRADFTPAWGFVGDIDYSESNRVYIHSSIACYLGMIDCQDVFPWSTDTICYAESELIMPGGSVGGTYNTREGWVFNSSLLEQLRIEVLLSGIEGNLFAPVHYAIKPYIPNRKDLVYCNTYFGDPGLAIYTAIPHSFNVTAPTELQIGTGYDIYIEVINSQSQQGVEDVLVTLYKDDELYQRGYTDGGGFVYFTINPLTPGIISLTCAKPDFLKHEQEIIITPSCDMGLPGDVNGDNDVIGSDITYGVNYFRGTGDPPVLKCWCPDFELYHAADANGDCQFIGSDITYLVNYFRGITELMTCPGCTGDSLAIEKKLDISQELID